MGLCVVVSKVGFMVTYQQGTAKSRVRMGGEAKRFVRVGGEVEEDRDGIEGEEKDENLQKQSISSVHRLFSPPNL